MSGFAVPRFVQTKLVAGDHLFPPAEPAPHIAHVLKSAGRVDSVFGFGLAAKFPHDRHDLFADLISARFGLASFCFVRLHLVFGRGYGAICFVLSDSAFEESGVSLLRIRFGSEPAVCFRSGTRVLVYAACFIASVVRLIFARLASDLRRQARAPVIRSDADCRPSSHMSALLMSSLVW